MKDRIFFKGKDYHERVFIEDILWIEGAGSSSVMRTNIKKIYISMNLKKVLERMSLDKIVRVHKSYAVNIDHIIALNHRSLQIQVNQNKTKSIPISEGYRSTIQNLIHTF